MWLLLPAFWAQPRSSVCDLRVPLLPTRATLPCRWISCRPLRTRRESRTIPGPCCWRSLLSTPSWRLSLHLRRAFLFVGSLLPPSLWRAGPELRVAKCPASPRWLSLRSATMCSMRSEQRPSQRTRLRLLFRLSCVRSIARSAMGTCSVWCCGADSGWNEPQMLRRMAPRGVRCLRAPPSIGFSRCRRSCSSWSPSFLAAWLSTLPIRLWQRPLSSVSSSRITFCRSPI